METIGFVLLMTGFVVAASTGWRGILAVILVALAAAFHFYPSVDKE